MFPHHQVGIGAMGRLYKRSVAGAHDAVEAYRLIFRNDEHVDGTAAQQTRGQATHRCQGKARLLPDNDEITPPFRGDMEDGIQAVALRREGRQTRARFLGHAHGFV